jgi:hypothetical protein
MAKLRIKPGPFTGRDVNRTKIPAGRWGIVDRHNRVVVPIAFRQLSLAELELSAQAIRRVQR